MAKEEKKETKEPYSFRGKPSIVEKARKKAKLANKSLSEKIEELLYDYISR